MITLVTCVVGHNNPLGHNNSTTIGIVLYPGFEELDVFGPRAILSFNKTYLITEKPGIVESRTGAQLKVDYHFQNHPQFDVLMIPGGIVKQQLTNPVIIQFIEEQAKKAQIVLTVCTGSALLAKTGLLDGLKATTNKMVWSSVTSRFPEVKWVRHARWAQDGKYISSSGVSAGTDMATYFVQKYLGEEILHIRLNFTEYIWNSDSNNDPYTFAEMDFPPDTLSYII
ncbi:hypothetical protein K7432_000596 [Basidiobolus ranarum]|uniref:DJ-1/PfpI domain-containing protein n=1 Tax=Basidiobolus ranarum TaxID=34480 RepID=A0ABR2X4C3_9FUNG